MSIKNYDSSEADPDDSDSDIQKNVSLNNVGVISTGRRDILKIIKSKKDNRKYICSKSVGQDPDIQVPIIDVNPKYDQQHTLYRIPQLPITVKKASSDRIHTRKKIKSKSIGKHKKINKVSRVKKNSEEIFEMDN